MTEHAGPQDTPPAGPAGRRSPGGGGVGRRAVAAVAAGRRKLGVQGGSPDREDVGSPAPNVVGRRLTGPVQGFGKMWRKTYRMDIGPGVSPREAIATWTAHFAEFWPEGNWIEAPLTGISPGEVALLDVGGGVRLSTAVFVPYADEKSFTLMTPQGHIFAGWITFSAERAQGGHGRPEAEEERSTIVQAQVLMRANDPLYELAQRRPRAPARAGQAIVSPGVDPADQWQGAG